MYVPQKEPELPEFEKEPGLKDPRAYDQQLMERIGSESEPKKKVRVSEKLEDDAVVEQEVRSMF